MITFENRYVQQLITLADVFVKDINKDMYIDNEVTVFEAEAKSLGYIKLGSGFFSQAWTHPRISDFAIKLGFKKEDSGAAYAAYCRNNQGKAGIPVIHSLDRFKTCYVVLMDKLNPYNKVSKLFYAKSEYYRLMERPKVVKPECMQDYELIRSFFLKWEEDRDPCKDVHHTALGIRDFFKGIAKFDLHTGNVMLDKDDNLIITDPVSYCCSAKIGADWRGRTPPRSTPKVYKAKFTKNKVEKGAFNAKKPAFLVARDARNGVIKR